MSLILSKISSPYYNDLIVVVSARRCTSESWINSSEKFDDVCPNKWVGRRGTFEWPPSSPDFNTLDFFFCATRENLFYKKKPDSIEEL